MDVYLHESSICGIDCSLIISNTDHLDLAMPTKIEALLLDRHVPGRREGCAGF